LHKALRVLTCLAALAIVSSAGTTLAKAVLGSSLLLTWLWTELGCAARPPCRVKVYPSGRCRMGTAEFMLGARVWSCPWYSVLTCAGAAGTRRLLVSAARQEPGDYRKLLCWVRFGRWDKPARQK
jgi:hypothetical protein